MLIDHSSIMFALAGIAFFMFGMTTASESLQSLTANRMRDLLSHITKRPSLGLLGGALMTLIVQSSGAITSMLVGLGSAGVLKLRQVVTIIFGVAIGTTFTVQLLSFKLTQFGLPVFAFAFIVSFLTRRQTLKKILGVFIGFGLIFWGLELIGVGTQALRTSDVFVEIIDFLKLNPLYTLLVTAAFTAVVHSSAVTIGFAMSLASTGLLDLNDAIFWVYGANIGTTATALIASTGGNYVGKQIALTHFLFKIISVALFYFATSYFAEFMSSGAISRDIANVHSLFNLIAAILFFPFSQKLAELIETLILPSASEQEFSAKYLDRSHHHNTSVAVAHAHREVMRMGDIVRYMVKDSLMLFKNEDEELEERIRESDQKVDHLNREINLYLTQLMEATDTLPREALRVIYFASDLESVGDVIDNSLLPLAQKKHNLKLEFSKEGWKELQQLHKQTMELTEISLSCFQLQKKNLASKVIFGKREIRKLEKKFKVSHIERLVKGKQETINTSAIHLDVLAEYRRIVGLMSNHVYSLMKDSNSYNILPRRSE